MLILVWENAEGRWIVVVAERNSSLHVLRGGPEPCFALRLLEDVVKECLRGRHDGQTGRCTESEQRTRTS